MATGGFSADIRKFGIKTKKQFVFVVQYTALELDSRVVMRTPVDFGRARANWQVTFGSPGVWKSKDINWQGSLARAKAKIATWDKSGDIFLTNNLPYIGRLENGWSAQAPNGMVSRTVVEFDSIVAEAIARSK